MEQSDVELFLKIMFISIVNEELQKVWEKRRGLSLNSTSACLERLTKTTNKKPLSNFNLCRIEECCLLGYYHGGNIDECPLEYYTVWL
jgi:hypothetical protein